MRNQNREALSLSLLKQSPSLGFDNLSANWIFLRFLQYFGEKEERDLVGYGLSSQYFDAIIDRDPRFVDTYLFLLISTTILNGSPEETASLMEEGLAQLSPGEPPRRAYYIWRYKALNEFLFLGDLEAARRSYTQAAEWASFYSDSESKNVEKISRGTADFLASQPDITKAQIAAWTSILSQTPDEDVQRAAIEKLEELGAPTSLPLLESRGDF